MGKFSFIGRRLTDRRLGLQSRSHHLSPTSMACTLRKMKSFSFQVNKQVGIDPNPLQSTWHENVLKAKNCFAYGHFHTIPNCLISEHTNIFYTSLRGQCMIHAFLWILYKIMEPNYISLTNIFKSPFNILDKSFDHFMSKLNRYQTAGFGLSQVRIQVWSW